MLSYDYVEYQHIKLHLFSTVGDTDWVNPILRIIKNTVIQYSDRVLDILFDDSKDEISSYLNTHYVRARPLPYKDIYFRTRFHRVEVSDNPISPTMILQDTALYRILKSIPCENKDICTWLSKLLYPDTPDTFRNNPIRNIIAYIGNSSLVNIQYMKKILSKLQTHHYSTLSDTNKIMLTFSKQPEYLFFDNHHTVNQLNINSLPKLPMDEFVFETDSIDMSIMDEEEEEECKSIIKNIQELTITQEDMEKNVRCKIVIRYGVRKGSVCNRLCKSNMIVCGIHHYASK